MFQLMSIILLATSLSMDAFSLALILGTIGFKRNMILKISITVGIFHFFMPLIGDMIGEHLLNVVPIEGGTIAGLLFLIIALQMLISAFKEHKEVIITSFLSVLFFAFTVSVDSFSVGISLSVISNNHILAATAFMTLSFLFTIAGLLLGKSLEKKFGIYATITGSILLLLCAVKYIL